MIGNFLKIAIRNLSRNKGYSLLNIGGLAIALIVFISIVLFVHHELTYDRFFSGSDRIYRVLMDHEHQQGLDIMSRLPEPIDADLQRIYPEVRRAVQVTESRDRMLVRGENEIYTDHWGAVTQSFFEIFDFPFLEGNPSTVLEQPNSVVLTRSLARELFGTRQAVGKTVTYVGQGEEVPYTVTGIIRDLPTNTHFTFEAFARRTPVSQTGWNYRVASTYIQLGNSEDVRSLREKLPSYAEDYKQLPPGAVGEYRFILQPVTDIHIYPQSREVQSSRMIYIRVLLVIGGLILLIAGLNYVNMATAQSAVRAREIGIRKTMGATRGQIITQITVESVLVCFSALLIAGSLLELFKPMIVSYLEFNLSPLLELSYGWIAVLVSSLLAVGVLGGSYSAFYLSSFEPTKALRGSKSGSGKSLAILRKGLVAAQFGISVAIIIASLVISRQVEYIRTERLDGQDEQVMVIHKEGESLIRQYDAFRQELVRHPDILSVSAGTLPARSPGWSKFQNERGEQIQVYSYFVDYGYLETLGLNLLEGRAFDPERESDLKSVILNETAARMLGYERSVGETIAQPEGRLIGIVEDFHSHTLFDPIQPVALELQDKSSFYLPMNIIVRFREGGISAGLSHVQSIWDRFEAVYPLSYSFLDQVLDQDYRAELRLSRIFNVFSGFSIFIACLGLFALAAYSAERRTREVGIRKVLGATATSIVALLSKEFLRLVTIGFVAAIPVAYLGTSWWLSDFAYRVEIGPGVFLLAGGVALAIALFAVGWHALHAALANPVDSLRSE